MPPTNSFPQNILRQKSHTEGTETFLRGDQKRSNAWGWGCSPDKVWTILKRDVFVIPCEAVPKNDDPVGRIIHNQSHPDKLSNSINSALTNTSVEYITFKERVARLSRVDRFIILGLENGDKQLPVHPSDLQTQMYSLGPNEFYIDVSIPYGRADSARVFSRWISLVQFVKISF